MKSPTSSREPSAPTASPVDPEPAAGQNEAPSDPLVEVDEVLHSWSIQRQDFVDIQDEAKAARDTFVRDALNLAITVIRPALDVLSARLTADGGSGRVDERLGDDSHSYRLTLWISLEGEIATPRKDLNPYLQLDLDVPNRRFNVWEGDMWEKQGSSRDSIPWQLEDITDEAVTQRVIAILRRAASHDVVDKRSTLGTKVPMPTTP
jgi:hypothetical protein